MESINKENQQMKKQIYCKFFPPWSNWTWYAMEYDPIEKMFFGYVKGFYEDEYGYFSLDEMESLKGPFGARVERDCYWRATTVKDMKVLSNE